MRGKIYEATFTTVSVSDANLLNDPAFSFSSLAFVSGATAKIELFVINTIGPIAPNISITRKVWDTNKVELRAENRSMEVIQKTSWVLLTERVVPGVGKITESLH